MSLFPTIGELAENSNSSKEAGPHDAEVIDDTDRPVQEIESLCMHCGENGMTRLLLTSIPFFREIVVMSFHCDHCGFQNNEVQSAGTIKDHGVAYSVHVSSRDDLNRQMVKSASCSIIIPEYELTIPPAKGQLTTIEGILRDTVTDLSADQPLRRIQAADAYEKIEHIVESFREILGDESHSETNPAVGGTGQSSTIKPFTFTLDDPAGDSFVEFRHSMNDPLWNMRTYKRTHEQNVMLGLVANDDVSDSGDGDTQSNVPTKTNLDKTSGSVGSEVKDVAEEEEVYIFPGTCSSCGAPSDTRMRKVNIPYFKDILIMSTNCEHCGYRDNEVKSGAAISEKGKRITLKVEDSEDLSRDILKSETCGLSIPEIELHLQAGTLGGRFTTLEGLLDQIYDELRDKLFASGDSTEDGTQSFKKFLDDLENVKTVKRKFTVILEDPLANSYLQNIYAPDPDPNMTIELFDRTWEQNEELGLNDMKVENYEATSKAAEN